MCGEVEELAPCCAKDWALKSVEGSGKCQTSLDDCERAKEGGDWVLVAC